MTTAEAAAAPVVQARGLTRRYAGVAVVDGLDVDIPEGCFWGLLGPNGAGKTTFLRMLIGQTPPSAGTLQVLGEPMPDGAHRARRWLGVVPQKDNLDPDFSVLENLVVFGDYFGLGRREVLARADELLAFAALEGRGEARISTLSGGMQRRLSLIRALVNRPRLLVLDEPTTGLDPQARQLIWQRLRRLRAEGMTVLLTTHFMDEAERLCDVVTVMDSGRILDAGAPRALIARHIEAHVVEVHGSGLDAFHARHGQLASRHERVGETAFYYADDPQPLLGALQSWSDLHCLHRPANLEDVFVKLTGRDLRDG